MNMKLIYRIEQFMYLSSYIFQVRYFLYLSLSLSLSESLIFMVLIRQVELLSLNRFILS